MATKIKGGLSYMVNKENQAQRENFGLDTETDDEWYKLAESEELEE